MLNIKIKDVGDTSNIFMFTCSNFHEMSFFFELYNAQLRGEQRNTEAAAYRLKH
ncbi:hypothetical protein D046_8432 [Vibrio parahaemolyticus V-223/04]|nr:hypothetical protein D046_8432 [Vibrio parahaemolyticus V-223/04]